MDLARARETMVDCQIRTVDVTNHGVISAFLAVPRHAFVPPMWGELAYSDAAIPVGSGRTLPSASAWARLVQLLAPQSDSTVLMIGCAGGYGAAILGALAARVVAIESDPALAAASRAALAKAGIANVEIRETGLDAASISDGPYERIVVEGAIDAMTPALEARLADGGSMVAVIGKGRAASAHLYRRSGQRVAGQMTFDIAMPPLPGFEAPQTFEFVLESGRR